MKIVIDSAVPFIQNVFENFFSEVVYKKGIDIRKEDIMDADAMVIRTRTICNAQLLEGTAVKAIATATIGTDHIDLDYCHNNNISVYNAAGCNAGGVMDYVFSALYGVAARKGIKIEGATLGIIGVGNVGRKVEKMGRALGFNVLCCDPPRAEAEGKQGFCDLEELLDCSDIVTLHVPKNEKTVGMAGEQFFHDMKPRSIFINASRGEIVDEAALKDAASKFSAIIIDTWNNEPDVDIDLIEMVDIATPHIAGYSFRGKQNGTSAAVRAIASHFNIDALRDFYPVSDKETSNLVILDVKGKNQGEIASLFQYNYPIFTDDFMFRINPSDFEAMRNGYNFRREFDLDYNG